MRKSLLLVLTAACLPAFAQSQGSLAERMANVEESIQLTQRKLKMPNDIAFLPDLHFMLAELLVEKSRLQLAIKREKNPKVPMDELDLTAERRPKLEAIEIYRQIADRFPKYPRLDKVLFFMAHELLELNRGDEALALYKKITDAFPDSQYWEEAQLGIGAHYFEKKDFAFAVDQYKKVVARPNGKGAGTAWYKIGWCHINQNKWLEAMNAFESSLQSFAKVKDQLKPLELKTSDMREEALVSSIWPYSELSPEQMRKNPRYLDPIGFYRGMSPDKFIYARAMARLGRRLAVKKRIAESAAAYYEAFRVTEQPSDKLDFLESYYLAFKESKQTYFPPGLSAMASETLMRMQILERTVPPKKQRVPAFEPVLRDVATSLHSSAESTKRKEDFAAAARAYEDYLYVYTQSKFSDDMKLNLASSRFHGDMKIDAARTYFGLAKATKNKSKMKEHLGSALQSLVGGLSDLLKLTPLQKHQGRELFKTAAHTFIRNFPQDPSVVDIRFNASKILYDERNFKNAVANFRKFIRLYPKSPRVQEAGLLLLDCFYQEDRLQDLLAEGKALMANNDLRKEDKEKFKSILEEARLKRVRSIAGDFGSKAYARKMLEMASSKEGADMAEPALYEAFLSLKSSANPKLFEVGENYVARFKSNEKSQAVLISLIQLALQSTDFKRAGTYLETYASRYPQDPQARAFSEQAVNIYRNLGMYEDAAEIAKGINQGERSLSLLAEGRSWRKLAEEASKGEGASSVYYHALAMLRSNNKDQARQLMARVMQSGSSDKGMLGHAMYVQAEAQYEAMSKFGQGQNITPQLIREKVELLNLVDRQVQVMLGNGDGRWAVAGLALLGRAQLEMVHFLKTAKPPPGVSTEQFAGIMNKQSEQYAQAARSLFAQCVKLGNENEVLTQFNFSCASEGKTALAESADEWSGFARGNPKTDSQLIAQLLANPRATAPLERRFEQAVSQKAWGLADLILTRMDEVKGAPADSEHGWVNLEAGRYSRAMEYFAKASGRDANLGKAALYSGFGLSQKLASIRGSLGGSRSPASVSSASRNNKWLQNALRGM